MLRWVGERLERLEQARQREVLLLLARGPLSGAELRRHFVLPLTLGRHLRQLHAAGLVAHNQRSDRYHLVRPALEAMADLCSELAGPVGREQGKDERAEVGPPERRKGQAPAL